MTNQATKIVILGGGYAGVMAAVRLAGKTRRLNTQITLVNGLDHFVERPRLHEAATGSEIRQPMLTHMLRDTAVSFQKGWVTAVDPDAQSVTINTENGEQTVAYDFLIYALGSQTIRKSVLGVDEFAYVLDAMGDRASGALHNRLNGLNMAEMVTVVGGGATGIEAACEVKAHYPDLNVQLVTADVVGGFKGERVQTHMLSALAEQGIGLYKDSLVKHVQEDGVALADGRFLPSTICVWCGGFEATGLARAAGMPVNARNQILADPFLRSTEYANIYAVGDAVGPVQDPGTPMRMSLFVALVTGALAADNITAVLKEKSQKPLSFATYGQAVSMGPNDAVGFNTFPADHAVGPIFRRKTAVRLRSFFVWFLMAFLEIERRFPGAFFWFGKGRFARQQRKMVDVETAVLPQ